MLVIILMKIDEVVLVVHTNNTLPRLLGQKVVFKLLEVIRLLKRHINQHLLEIKALGEKDARHEIHHVADIVARLPHRVQRAIRNQNLGNDLPHHIVLGLGLEIKIEKTRNKLDIHPRIFNEKKKLVVDVALYMIVLDINQQKRSIKSTEINRKNCFIQHHVNGHFFK
jgi:hypothetical protein